MDMIPLSVIPLSLPLTDRISRFRQPSDINLKPTSVTKKHPVMFNLDKSLQHLDIDSMPKTLKMAIRNNSCHQYGYFK